MYHPHLIENRGTRIQTMPRYDILLIPPHTLNIFLQIGSFDNRSLEKTTNNNLSKYWPLGKKENKQPMQAVKSVSSERLQVLSIIIIADILTQNFSKCRWEKNQLFP